MTAVDAGSAPDVEPGGLPRLPPRVVYLIAARDAMPGYTATQEAVQRTRRQVMVPAPGGLAPYPDVDALAAAAVDGEPVPDDLGELVLAADRAKAAEEARRQWTESVAVRLEAELANVASAEVDHALRFLDAELQTILAAARAALQVAGGIQTPEAALRAGNDQREAFVQIDELTRRLADLRTAQEQVMAVALDHMSETHSNTDHLLRHAGTVANLAEVLPDWREVSKNGGRSLGRFDGYADAGDPQYRLTPWRPLGPQNVLRPVVDRDHLVWLVESAAVPWVPTIREARTATELLLAADREVWTEQDERKYEGLARDHEQRVRASMLLHRYQTTGNY